MGVANQLVSAWQPTSQNLNGGRSRKAGRGGPRDTPDFSTALTGPFIQNLITPFSTMFGMGLVLAPPNGRVTKFFEDDTYFKNRRTLVLLGSGGSGT